jgi:hypothetical protein
MSGKGGEKCDVPTRETNREKWDRNQEETKYKEVKKYDSLASGERE